MAGQFAKVLTYLRTIGSAPRRDNDDASLLTAYVNDHDESAFGEIMRRHGNLVWGTCKRILHDPHDADDAFQATFLVLAKRASGLSVQGSLAGWLYGVAQRVALRSRQRAAKRRTREQEGVMDLANPSLQQEQSWTDLRPVLDEELLRLPRRFRDPIILCYLQGKTHDEAATELGMPRSSLGRWILRARELLRQRLEQRGITLATGALATVLSEQAASAVVPSAVAEPCVRAAMAIATGTASVGSILPMQAVEAADDLLRSLHAVKVRLVTCVVFAALFSMTGAGLWAHKRLAAPAPTTAYKEWRCEEAVEVLAFDPSGKRLASTNLDGTIFCWERSTGRQLFRTSRVVEGFRGLCRLTFSPDGTLLASVAAHERVTLCDAASGARVADIGEATVSPIVAFTADGTHILAPTSTPGDIGIWDAATRKQVGTQKVAENSIDSLVVAGDRFAVCSGDTLYLWDWPSRECTDRLKLNGVRSCSAVFSHDGSTVAAFGLGDGVMPLKVWSTSTKKALVGISDFDSDIQSISLSADGSLLAVAFGQENDLYRLCVIDVATGRRKELLPKGENPIWSVAFSADGQWLACGTNNGLVRVWPASSLR